jgi:hypothetical protein
MTPPRGTCQRPPSGWWCSRNGNHPGPCPTRPTWWNLPARLRLWNLR